MSYKFFENKDCEYYPCHRHNGTTKVNCLFCFCPLYNKQCKGNYKILSNGIKDCSDCLLPHIDSGYEYIINILKEDINGST